MPLRTNFCRLLSWAALAGLAGCIEPYDPKTAGAGGNYLVVDGFINSQGMTTIKLSRTAELKANGNPPAEVRARVLVEDEQGQQFALTETSVPGTYTSAVRTLDPARKYRLRLSTSSGQQYASAYTAVKNTPPFDGVSWGIEDDAVQIYVSSHDATAQSKYYRWDYDETWEFTAAFRSGVQFVNGVMEPRTEEMYRCWRNEPGTAVKLATTTRLNTDALVNHPLLKVPRTSGKMRVKYSILVTQYTLTPEEYQYWEALRKNTESIGTLFDPLPSQNQGNLSCLSDPDQLVIGFVGVHSQVQQRIFIDAAQMPQNWLIPNPGYENCQEDTVTFFRDQVRIVFSSPANIPTREAVTRTGRQIGYMGTSVQCADCRLRGTTVRPAYWR